MIHTIVLSIIQGLAEFLPISSSAHLSLLPWITGWPDPGLSFDVALHMGTLAAVIIYFWRDWIKLLQSWFTSLYNRKIKTLDERLSWYIVVGSIPGAIAGALLEKEAETIFRTPILTASVLLLVGLIILITDRKKESKEINNLTWRDTITIGVAQAFAIVPGVSRSGATISYGRYLGLSRYDAAKFSFLLSGPIIAGAGLEQLLSGSLKIGLPEIIGFLVSGLVGILAIGFLLNYLIKSKLTIFVWYRWLLALFVIILYFLRLG